MSCCVCLGAGQGKGHCPGKTRRACASGAGSEKTGRISRWGLVVRAEKDLICFGSVDGSICSLTFFGGMVSEFSVSDSS